MHTQSVTFLLLHAMYLLAAIKNRNMPINISLSNASVTEDNINESTNEETGKLLVETISSRCL